MKKAKLFIAALCMSATMAMTSFAGQWQQDSIGWWYQNDDGSYPVNTWQWIDGNGDGLAESYYFDSNGYCLMNTTVPDGSAVDSSGAWIINGVVQTMEVEQTAAQDPAQPQQTSGAGQEAAAVVYWTPNGKSYHNSRDCVTLKRSKTIHQGSLNDALSAGKEDPCNVCVR